MIRVSSPRTLQTGQYIFELSGWCATTDKSPVFSARLFGEVLLEATLSEPDNVEQVLPRRQSYRFSVLVDLTQNRHAAKAAWKNAGASVFVDIVNGTESGRIEWGISQEYVDGLLEPAHGFPVKQFPPEDLQTRVAGEAGAPFSSFGDTAVRQIVSLARAAGLDDSLPFEVLDFGCGCGRVARVFKEMYPHANLCGCDIDPEAVEWCRQHLGRSGSFVANDILPPLPFETNRFDLIYGISIFTHLPEDFQFAWLVELRRILKPGGVLVCTVHGPATIDYIVELYPSTASLREKVKRLGFVYVNEREEGWPSFFGAPTAGLPEFYKLTYHSHAYVTEKWSRFFDIVHCGEFDLNILQDAIVGRKTSGGDEEFASLGLSFREAAARAALKESERALRELKQLSNERLTLLLETDRALGEAQRIAISRLSELETAQQELARLNAEKDLR